MTTGSFRLTGLHVLAMFVAFFLTIIAANAIFITMAVKSFPGEQEKKSYLQGLAYNDRLKAREVQAALGWTAEIASVRLESGKTEIDVVFASSMTAPISGLTITGSLSRAVDDESDHAVEFHAIAPGRYRAALDGVAPGAWRMAATATNDRGAVFILEKRLILK